MKASNRSNKNVNLNLKDSTPNKDPIGSAKFSRLSPIVTQCYLLGALSWLSWLFEHARDGLSSNHNEMFLADVSKPAKSA